MAGRAGGAGVWEWWEVVEGQGAGEVLRRRAGRVKVSLPTSVLHYSDF